jgi:integrase
MSVAAVGWHSPARKFFPALCNSGCRLGEIRNASAKDVDSQDGILTVIRKGGKIDQVIMNDMMRICIPDEMESRGNPRPHEPLFLNNHGKRYQRITRSLRTACVNSGVPHCTHHSLRHAYARMLHEAGTESGVNY